jgi:hypothetical protein
MYRELDAEFAVVSERGFRNPVANITRVTALLECSSDPNLRQALCYAQRAWIQLDQQNWCQPSEKNTWAKAAAKLTVERQASIFDINEAITTTTLMEVRPLVGGSSHLQEATHDTLIIPTIRILKKTCARKSMKDVMRDP